MDIMKERSIPQLDLSGRLADQVVVDREKGQYLGHVTTVLLDDGKTIYAAYPKHHALGQVALKRSDDGGQNWSARLPVPKSWSWSMECPTLFKLTDARGKRRLFLFSGGFPAQRSVSEDDGATWSEFEPFGFGGIVFLSTMVCLGPGHYLAMFHDEGQFIHGGDEVLWEAFARGEGAARVSVFTWRAKQADGAWGERHVAGWHPNPPMPDATWEKVYETRSGRPFADGHFELMSIRTFDGGMTWSEPVSVPHPNDMKLCEPCLVRSPDERRLAVLLRENSRRYNSAIMFSDDQGRSWSAPVELPAALTGDRHTARYLPDGRLFITFRDMARGSDTMGSWIGWFGTFDDLAGGGEGEYRVLIKRNTYSFDCAYPGLELLPDGTLVAVTYGHWDQGEMPYIVAARLVPTQLDALAAKVRTDGRNA